MNVATPSLLPTLTGTPKDLVCLVEFYEATYVPTVHGFEPPSAVARFATETCSFKLDGTVGPASYYREALHMPSLTRILGKQSNTCTVRFSNISRRLATFKITNDVEGMRMVVRICSRANLLADFGVGGNGWSFFNGRCGPPDGFDRKEGSITAKQDLGQIEAQIPPQDFERPCWLDFGGPDCLGTELLTEKNAAYQTAFATFGRKGCNKSHTQCTEFDNVKFFQGIRVVQIQGSFLFKPHHGFLYKLIRYSSVVGYLGTRFFGTKAHEVGSSVEDGTPYGHAVPIVLGRWQMSGMPLQFQDVGTELHFLMAFCRGPIGGYGNIRNNTVGFTSPFDVIEHYGNYGGEANQLADTVFPEGQFFSRLAYITGAVAGSDIEVEEPAPDISAIVKGIAIGELVNADYLNRQGTGTVYGETVEYSETFGAWTDNPVEQVRHVLRDPALLNFGPANTWLDHRRTGVTSVYCLGGVQDLTNAERLVLPNDQIGKAGVDYHRYHTTGLLVPESYRVGVQQFPESQAFKEVEYEYYDPSAPPDSFAIKTWYRKRFTSNIALSEHKKALDFVYDTLLPSFRGYLSWNHLGKIASVAGATSIDVMDVYPWTFNGNEENDSKIGEILIGAWKANSEARVVTDTHYTADGNLITLSASTTGGVTATASGANFTGGSSTVRAEGSVTIGGSPVAGDTISVFINGYECFYELTPGVYGSGASTEAGVAASLAFAINSHPVVRTFVEASSGSFGDDTVLLTCKMGSLDLSSELEEAHEEGEETIRVMMVFAGKALTHADTTRANILNGSFKYLGANGQTRYNQFKGSPHDPLRDFAEQPIIINDYDHQDKVNKVFTLDVDLSAVDNYNQASRLLNGANAKFGDGCKFFTWGSNGLALQLEEGDRVAVNYPMAPVWWPNREYALGDLVVPVPLNGHRYVVTTAGTSGLIQPDFPDGTGATVTSGSVVFTEYGSDEKDAFRNIPVTIEQLTTNEKYEVSFTARIYSTSFFDDAVAETDVQLSSSLGNFGAGPPDIAFNTVDFPPDGLIQTTDGTAGITTIRGGAIFGDSVYMQYGKVSVKRPGDTDFEQITILHPDSNLEATFEFIASVDGLYTVQLEVCGQWGCNTTKPTATIIVGFGTLSGIAKQGGVLIAKQGGTLMEKQHA
jgi:hypothetical protein